MGFTAEEDRESEWKALVDSLELLKLDIEKKDLKTAKKRINYILEEMVKG